jgi:hypothetical protein
MAVLPLWLGACSSIDFSQINAPKLDTSTLFVPNPTQFAPKQESSKPVTPADLVDGNGYCAGMTAPPTPTQTSESGADPAASTIPAAPLSGRNVALQMTECEVIQAQGRPAEIQSAANERGERMVTMTYMTPERPIYRFVAGRLATIERGAEPPPPEPVKKKKPASKRAIRQAT